MSFLLPSKFKAKASLCTGSQSRNGHSYQVLSFMAFHIMPFKWTVRSQSLLFMMRSTVTKLNDQKYEFSPFNDWAKAGVSHPEEWCCMGTWLDKTTRKCQSTLSIMCRVWIKSAIYDGYIRIRLNSWIFWSLRNHSIWNFVWTWWFMTFSSGLDSYPSSKYTQIIGWAKFVSLS